MARRYRPAVKVFQNLPRGPSGWTSSRESSKTLSTEADMMKSSSTSLMVWREIARVSPV